MMKILISVGHPAHVHFFKNIIWALEKKGHEIKIIARNKEVCINLLETYGFDYDLISNSGSGLFGLGIEMISRVIKIIPLIKNFNPDLILSMMDPSIAIGAKIFGKKYISLADTEHATFIIKSVLPLTDVVLTPSCFKKELGIKQIRYAGYHELAYLHPNYFTPNSEVLNELGLSEDYTFIILRFISWNAHHDIGQQGIQNKIELVKKLEKYGRVLITSEGDIDSELEKYKIKVSPEKLHDLLYYATLYIGEGGTTASESAVLGTHAIHISTTAKYCGVFNNIYNYGLMWTYDDENGAIDLIQELLQKTDLLEKGKRKRDILVSENINVTDFMVWLLDNYPRSLKMIKQNPDSTINVGDLL